MEYSSSLVWQFTLLFAICVAVVCFSGNNSLKYLIHCKKNVFRSNVPWGVDVAVILFLLYVVLLPTISLKITSLTVPSLNLDAVSTSQSDQDVEISNSILETSKDDSNVSAQVETKNKNRSVATQHPMARLLIRSYGSSRFPLATFCFFLAVVCVAPLTEEFIFRVVLQGAFEKTISTKKIPSIWKGALAIGTSALIFALLHTGDVESANAPISCDVLFNMTTSSILSNSITLALGVFILRRYYEVKLRDIGCDYSFSMKTQGVRKTCFHLLKDFYQGVVLYLIAAPIILGVNVIAQKIFPNAIVAPIPIFLFALWNGFIYYQTRQYATCVGTHVALNFTSFVILFLNVRAHTFGVVS